MMSYDVGILGGGESGIAAALLAHKHRVSIFLSEYHQLAESDRNVLIKHNIEFEEHGHSMETLSQCMLIIKSPGIAQSAPIVCQLRELGISIISEIEYAFRYVPAGSTVIAITGSNGKTTTSNLIHHMLDVGGYNCAKGGNLSPSFSFLLCHDPVDYYVIEVSSFQLEDIAIFRPTIAIILNISPDHLDRYGYNVDAYADTKFKICANQGVGDLLLYNADDITITTRLDTLDNESDKVGIHRELPIPKSSKPYLLGEHNRMNALFAIYVARHLGLADELILDGLEDFVNDDHRMQPVARIDGISWINDSKATNVDAVRYALMSIASDIIWIVGGVDKGNDYTGLKELVQHRVKYIIALGIDNSKILQAFGLEQTVVSTVTMHEAISVAVGIATSGDTVLLSPACASFDLFDSFKDRGEQFINEVNSQVIEKK